ncbi:hypothetical protein SSPIM334S_03241 [Streptomyces spiroverticillatus]
MYVPGPRTLEGTNPVNKKLAAALSGGAVLVMMATLSGCGDDAEDKAKEWSKSYCPKENAAVEKATKAEKLISSVAADGKPEELKKVDIQAFQMYGDAARDRIKALKEAGVPPVENGERDHKEMILNLDAKAKAYDELKKQAEALDPASKEFPKALDKIGADLGKADKLPAPKIFCPSSNAGASTSPS